MMGAIAKQATKALCAFKTQLAIFTEKELRGELVGKGVKVNGQGSGMQ